MKINDEFHFSHLFYRETMNLLVQKTRINGSIGKISQRPNKRVI